MENYGISQIDSIKTPDIAIFMYDEDYELHFIKNRCKYRLSKVEFHIKTDLGIAESHIKSACVALINSGVLNSGDVDISGTGFECEKLT